MAGILKNSDDKKLRVLQIFGRPEMGGTENQLLLFLQRYDRNKFVVDVACLGGTEGSLRDKYLATSTRLITCKWSSYVIPFFWRLLKLLRQQRYDVIHARMAEVSGAAILAARLAGVPNRICSYHHTETDWRNPGMINRLAVRIMHWIARKWAAKILGVSSASLDAFHPGWKQRSEQFQVCYNGIDTKRFSEAVTRNVIRSELGLPIDCMVVGHVGGFRKVKNHQAFVEIAKCVFKHYANVHFLLVGEGVLRHQIEQEVERLNLSNRFVFTGIRKDVPRMLAVMDVFVMPSLNEGFPSVLLEAQLSGLPVVSSDLPSIREALCPAMHKFCCDPHDFESMAEHVELLLGDPQLRSELGQQGQAYVSERFSICRTVKQLESLYAGEI
ncbi:MAG: glycosyltransferase [Planctomycetota bacterium]|jgi:glycosyltransferase involved in cell wall biosynthesis